MPTKTAHRLTNATDALSRLLPDAEAEIMRLVWRILRATVKDVHRIRAKGREPAYTTTMTAACQEDRRRHAETRAGYRLRNGQRGFCFVKAPSNKHLNRLYSGSRASADWWRWGEITPIHLP
jgi:Penicillinase repressor